MVVSFIDIGNASHFVAVPADRDAEPVREFGSWTGALLGMAEWLKKCGIRTVVMQSTGVYWVAAHDVLEKTGFEVWLVNARGTKNLSGVTGLRIIRAIVSGQRNPRQLAKLRDVRVRASEEEIVCSLEGHWQSDVLFDLKQALETYDFHQQRASIIWDRRNFRGGLAAGDRRQFSHALGELPAPAFRKE